MSAVKPTGNSCIWADDGSSRTLLHVVYAGSFVFARTFLIFAVTGPLNNGFLVTGLSPLVSQRDNMAPTSGVGKKLNLAGRTHKAKIGKSPSACLPSDGYCELSSSVMVYSHFCGDTSSIGVTTAFIVTSTSGVGQSLTINFGCVSYFRQS